MHLGCKQNGVLYISRSRRSELLSREEFESSQIIVDSIPQYEMKTQMTILMAYENLPASATHSKIDKTAINLRM